MPEGTDVRTAEVDGRAVSVGHLDDHVTALEVLRSTGCTGPKDVCGGGVCGACTIQLDGTPVASCLLPAVALAGRTVTTVHGLSAAGPHPVQRAFAAADALQCGFCTPGFVTAAAAFVDRWRAEHGDVAPPRDAIGAALAGNLCRCGAYDAIHRAVAAACAGEHDDPAPLVGARHDAAPKVRGDAVYTADVRLDGMLEGVVVRATAPHLTDVALDLSVAAEMPDVVVAPMLAEGDPTVRFVGQVVAAVAAPTLDLAAQAAAMVAVLGAEAPATIGLDAAMAPDAALVFADRAARKGAFGGGEQQAIPARWHGNVRGPVRLGWRGGTAERRITRARSASDPLLVETTFETAGQVHTALEPHVAVADVRADGTVRLWASTQAVGDLARAVAARLEVPVGGVEVIAEHVGGGFGGKLSMTDEVVAACLLSRVAGCPVRVRWSRAEELSAAGYRPPTRSRISLLAAVDGSLAALRLDVESDGGTSIGASAAAQSLLLYGRTPRVVRDLDVVSHAAPGCAFRAPGGPPMAWALEQAVDEAAHRLGTDPLELRRRWDGNERRHALYDWAGALPAWRDRGPVGSSSGRLRRGIGAAMSSWMYFVDPGTEVTCEVRDGRVVVTCSTQDMGTGTRTVLANAAAAVLGIDPEDVDVEIGRSSPSHGPTSGGSRTAASVFPTTTAATEALRDEVVAVAAGELGLAEARPIDGGIAHRDGVVPWKEALAAAPGVRGAATRGADLARRVVPFGDSQAGRGLTGAVHLCEVEVDTRLGRTRVLRAWAGLAVGRVLAEGPARSQVEGALVQGIGYALFEERAVDPHTGAVVSASLEDYRIPGMADTPEIEVHFHTEGWEHVPGGGVGIGEVAAVGVAAAVGNAVHHATGWRPTVAPVTPARLLEGLGS